MLGVRSFLVSFAVLAAPAAAQTEVRVAVQTPIFATAGAGQRMASYIPATLVAAPVNAAAQAAFTGPGSTASAEATSWVVPQPLGAVWSANVEAQGPPAGLFPGFSFAEVRGTVRVTIDDTGPGDLVISARYVGDLLGDVRLQASVSGSPGVPTVQWSLLSPFGPKCVRAPIAPEGPVVVDVSLQLMAWVTGRTVSGNLAFQVQWVPRGALTAPTMLPTWPGCGPVLFGTDDPTAGVHALEFTTRNAIPRAPLVLVFGVARASAPLAPSCLLHVQPISGVLLLADETGTASLPLTLPAAVPTALIFVQAVPFDATGAIRTSNLLEVQFGDC